MLRWRYDEPARVLRLDDGRVRLNCCGHRTMTIERVDGSLLEVTQCDEPDAGGRCATACEFDLSVDVPGVRAGDMFVTLLRDVTDEGGSPLLLWHCRVVSAKRVVERGRRVQLLEHAGRPAARAKSQMRLWSRKDAGVLKGREEPTFV